ncbi:MAG: hypothetical protein K9L70_10260 [Thiohalocapsa sp.]|nr:hypothetical protein [Thiohalocapsa sp.]
MPEQSGAATGYPLRAVGRLPRGWLRLAAGGVHVPVQWRRCRDDGLGAQGWKLVANVDDPEIIAVTGHASGPVGTSVLVHDILDHLLCGFAASGHRAEAMALRQLTLRSGSDPTPDYPIPSKTATNTAWRGISKSTSTGRMSCAHI